MSGSRAADEIWRLDRGDPDYPPQLCDLDHVDGVDDAPAALFGCGSTAALAAAAIDSAVTVVGSRRATPYGLSIAARLGHDLATAGLVVVSGLAYGIDAAAHRGALEAGGTTIAVLAGGADVVYPARARSLYRRILDRGAAISERRPGTLPERWAFPTRNRIMAALAKVTVVVEAAQPSGSTVTAGHALKLGRTVAALPGPVNSAVSRGTIALIRDGAAVVTGAEDVLDLFYGVGAGASARVGPPVDPELAPVLAAVEGGAAGPDAVAAATGVDGRAVAVALTRLELLGYLRSGSIGLYSRTALEPPQSTMAG